ncbi:SrfA family protein [Bordetella trematum]|uniref:SrfA family protein n=1 Tax=Bordetella trematum TaxID=123899 RepID=UPI003989870E
MSGVKLRSEKIDQYDALGERGQAVYLAAPQILSTLKRRRADLAQHFAIPQPSADGRVIDWYAPQNGAVVPWAAATEGERAAATARLDQVRQEVEALRASLGEGSDSLFAQLLRWVLHHPDSSHVYLVDGTPVVTFWGFLNAGADRNLAPLLALGAAPLAAARPVAAAAAPVAAAPVAAEVVRQPWWRRWWLWLLPLLLLLALLFFGLRACTPTAPALPAVSLPSVDMPSIGVPSVKLPEVSLPAVTAPVVAVPGATAPGAATVIPAAPAGSAAVASSVSAAAAMPAAAAPVAGNPVTPGLPSGPAPAIPAQPAGAHPPALPAGEAPGLAIPPQLPDGKADFLNGDWRVRAGIQDRNTGEPLRLQYQFKQGEGHVTLDRHNGVQCRAPVSAAMSGGTLMISNGAAAACSDGSTYDMPAIRCQPNGAQVAACTGNYGAEQFPLTMRQPQP